MGLPREREHFLDLFQNNFKFLRKTQSQYRKSVSLGTPQVSPSQEVSISTLLMSYLLTSPLMSFLWPRSQVKPRGGAG